MNRSCSLAMLISQIWEGELRIGPLPISKTQVCRILEPGILITILFWQVVGGKPSSTQLGEYAPSVLQDASKGGGGMPFWGCHRVLSLASLVGSPSYQCYRLSL